MTSSTRSVGTTRARIANSATAQPKRKKPSLSIQFAARVDHFAISSNGISVHVQIDPAPAGWPVRSSVDNALGPVSGLAPTTEQ